MKIVKSIDTVFNTNYEYMEVLKKRVDDLFINNKNPLWHYVSRIKAEESYALKLETGRVSNPAELEDFFACTIVVENLSQIEFAIRLVEKFCIIEERRPKETSFTHKEPHSFQFDDLRLYVKLKKDEYTPASPIYNFLFEIQIKTFLQHAWTIATHGLIYKSDTISWSKERIAFQIKAMLEHAELSIAGVENLATFPEIAKEDKNSIDLKKILKIYTDFFEVEALPKDIVRLCKNTQSLLYALRLSGDELAEILEKEREEGRGPHISNLSPYLIVVQSIIYQKKRVH